MEKKKVTFNVSEQLYCEYKKALIDERTTPTADFARHMYDVVEKAKGKEAKGSQEVEEGL